MTKLKISFVLLTILLTACQTKNNNNNPSSGSEKLTLDKIVAEYTEESLEFSPISATFQGKHEYNDQFGPIISQQSNQKFQKFNQKYLHQIDSVDPKKLSGQDLLTYKIFKRDREESLQSLRFNDHYIPINQMRGMHNFYALLGSGQSAQPFKTEKDYRNFIKRSEGFAKWMDSVVLAMREGIQKDVVLPKPIVKKLIPQLKAHLVDQVENSVFYAPLKKLPEGLEEQSRAKLMTEYRASIINIIIPAYRRLHQFMVDEYSQHARTSIGLSELSDGKAWYEFKIKTHTTLPLTAKEIHQFGLGEVARILSEMKKVKRQVDFKGDLPEFFEFLRTDNQFYFEKPEELIKAYEDTKDRIGATLPKLFEVFPKADYVVKPVAAFQAASSAGASYQSPSPDGTRPGIFYINTYNLKSQPKFIMETLSIHEAAPGHHFQIAIQQEVEGLPDFRKFGGYTVFNEGWALYAESLGKELGLFTDPYMWYGRLVDEQLRAMRLVVDTGIHAFGWSRTKAIDYMLANSSMARSDVEAEVERYIVIPGQALSYKIGQREIRQLRERAENELADKFDIKKFHTQILVDGSMPMPILREKIESWIKTQK